MTYTTDALIIREVAYDDNDKLLTLLTAEYGRVNVMAKGARSMRSGLMTASQLYSWGNYVIYSKGERHWLREATLIEPFFGLRNDLERLSLAAYLCDVTYEATGEMAEAAEILRVVLNTLYALAHEVASPLLIKAAFELRVAAMSGFLPDLSECAHCACSSAEVMYLDVMNGALICGDCMKGDSLAQRRPDPAYEIEPTRIFLPVPQGALAAMRYVLSAPAKRLYAFRLDSADEPDFFRACESYLLNHFERGFSSLDFFHSLKSISPASLPTKKD